MPCLDGAAPLILPRNSQPLLVVVVDTEEEFDWSRPLSRANVATTAIAAQRIAHDKVFSPLGVRPVYVADYPVATDPSAVAALAALATAGACEIGAHLHPWVTPPHDEIVCPRNSYAGNLPPALERAKLRLLTETIERAFGHRPQAYKAGRYGIGRHTAAALADLGYRVDFSVVPRTAFTADGGPDFRGRDAHPSLWPGGLLELPTSAGFSGAMAGLGPVLHPRLPRPLPGLLARTRLLERARLTPEGVSLAEMIRLTRALFAQGIRVFNLAYHSPSLVPGHTPYVRTPEDLADFLDRLRGYLSFFGDSLGGAFVTAAELHRRLVTRPPHAMSEPTANPAIAPG